MTAILAASFIAKTASAIGPAQWPYITQQPESKVAALGGKVRLSARVEGATPMRYQWWKDDLKLSSSSRISGVTSTNLNIAALNLGDAGDYYLVASNRYGLATSLVAVLEIEPAPASIALADYFYPMVAGNWWEFEGTDYDGSPAIRTEIIADLQRPVTSYTGRSAPRAYVTNLVCITKGYGVPGGQGPFDTWDDFYSVEDQQVLFWGDDDEDDDDDESLRVDRGLLLGSTVKVGQTIRSTRDLYSHGVYAGTVSAIVTILEWGSVTVPAGMFRDSLHLKFTFVRGGRTDSQEEWWVRGIGPVKHRNVPDDGEDRLDLARYIVVTPPRILTQPQDITAPAGAPATFHVVAEGAGTLRYQWHKNGQELPGESGDTLAFASISAADAGNYSVIVTDDNGTARSRAAVLALGAERWPPLLEVTSHADNEMVSSRSIVLSGTASDAGQGGSGIAWVRVNGVRASGDTAAASEVANWSRPVTLIQGLNTLKITASDGKANVTTNVIHVLADSVAPIAVITYPSVGRRLTNAVITATGRASDKHLASVWVRLNDGDWTQPSGLTNWNIALSIAPGSNTLQAFALDAFGNRSATNRVRFNYVVYLPASVEVSPGGTVVPNYNGKLLEIGKRYYMKATPAAGFRFDGWRDGQDHWLTNSATLYFTMASNLVLKASFVDVQKPSVVVRSPAPGARFTTSLLSAEGSCRDNNRVEAVLCRLNDEDWIQAAGTSQWTFNSQMRPGPNILSVYAVDPAGNCSVTSHVAITYYHDVVYTYWPMHSGDYKTFSGPIGQASVYFYGDGWDGYEMELNTSEGDVTSDYEYSYDRSELLLTGGEQGWMNFSFSPPVVELTASQIINGGSRTTSSYVSVSGQRVPVKVTTTVAPAGTVTVPAGTYLDCRKVTAKATATYNGQTAALSAEAYILAPRVGMIKVGVYRVSSSGSATLLGWEELTEGMVNGVPVSDLASP